MVELKKSAFHTEEFHCLDFLLLDARNESCNAYLYCIIYCNFTEIFTHCIYWNYLIFIVVFIHVFC